MLSLLVSRILLILMTVFPLAINTISGQVQKPKFVFVDPNISAQKWIGKKMPNFNLFNKKGNIYNNQSTRGRIVVFNLWSVYCHPCIDEFPELNNLVEKYFNNDIIFLAPAPESFEQINTVLSTHALSYTILPKAQSFIKATGLIGYPYHIITDRNGIIRYIHIGTVNRKTGKKIAETELPMNIDRLLNEQ